MSACHEGYLTRCNEWVCGPRPCIDHRTEQDRRFAVPDLHHPSPERHLFQENAPGYRDRPNAKNQVFSLFSELNVEQGFAFDYQVTFPVTLGFAIDYAGTFSVTFGFLGPTS